MKDSAFWGVLGFVLGIFTGGYVVGTQCAKKHRSVVDELHSEIDELIEEHERSDEEALLEASRGIVGSSQNIRSNYAENDDDIFDEDYEFDDPFDSSEEHCKVPRIGKDSIVIIKDLKSGAEMKFNSASDILDFLDFNHACETGELMAKTASGDTAAYRKLSERYRSDVFERMAGEADHPHDSGENDYDPDDIFIIDPDTFKKEVAYRDDETITYYQQDGVLINSADQLIGDQERCIGKAALDEVGKTDEDYLYVDNQVENKVYEICIEHKYSYYRDILGSTC